MIELVTAAIVRLRAPTRSAFLAGMSLLLASCAREPRPTFAEARTQTLRAPPPACAEIAVEPGPWPRSTAPAIVAHGVGGVDHLAQAIGARAPSRLRFLGAHLFDLLDKLEHEAGPEEIDRRRVICAALNAAAADGAPVVRVWGSLKRTGSAAELERAVSLLALVLDEDARRERPLRILVTLVNHQGGYGAPNPAASLDDQDPASPWSARRMYLTDGWRARGVGQLAERIERLGADRAIAESPYVIAWELVNELDTHRSIAAGSLRGPEADALRDRFLVPALAMLAQKLPQPLMLGELRGAETGYEVFVRSVIARLPEAARARLVWTSHVYVPEGASSDALAAATGKLDRDLAIAREHHLPFVLGELGQRARGAASFCGRGGPHDLAALFAGALDPPSRAAIDAAFFWGEGHCALPVPGTSRRITIGAGGDSADLAPGDSASRAAVRSARSSLRFRTSW